MERVHGADATMSMEMRRKQLLFGLAMMLVVATGAGMVWLRRTHTMAAVKSLPPKAQAAGPAEVSYQGQIRARDLVSVGVTSDGRLTALHAGPGDEVYEGQLLAEVQSD